MKLYEAGRESSLLDDILIGDKRIECRLNRGQYADYVVGDRVRIRRDIYRNGLQIGEIKDQAEVEITKLDNFPTFQDMFVTIGYDRAIPRATSIEEAVSQCRIFYTENEEKAVGVRAIHFKLIWPKI